MSAPRQPIEKTFTDPETGRDWRLRILKPGDAYGRDNALTWEGAPDADYAAIGIEFWDMTPTRNAPAFPQGQFVSRYLASILLYDRLYGTESTNPIDKNRRTGLCLQGGVPEWSISGELLTRVLGWVVAECPEINTQVVERMKKDREEVAMAFCMQIAQRFPSYVSEDDTGLDIVRRAQQLEDRLRADIPDRRDVDWHWSTHPDDGVILWPDNAEFPYKKADLIALCRGDEPTARSLYALCESGACPETIIDADSHEQEEDQCFAICHPVAITVPQP